MIKKKSKFLTFIFSTMFGAGHMYMGFMKEGISIMSAAAIIIFAGTWLNIGPVVFILPVLWCYGFFDAMNKRSMPDEIFQAQEDHFLFIEHYENIQMNKLITKHSNKIAIILILIGVISLGQNFLDYMMNIFNINYESRLYSLFNSFRWDMPRLIFSGIIIYIGVKMIMGKKKELNEFYDDVVVSTAEIKPVFPTNELMIKEQKSNENS
jgi:hypothetical protein